MLTELPITHACEDPVKRIAFLIRPFLLCLFLMASSASHGQTIADLYPQVREFFPHADRFGALEGEPLAAEIHQDGKLIGYVYLSGNVVRIPAYSGRPINTLVGFDMDGRIVGVRIVEHQEPILLVGISEERLHRFVHQYQGKSIFDQIVIGGGRDDAVAVDTISGATITVMVENATIMRSARQVAESRGLVPPSAVPLAVSGRSEREEEKSHEERKESRPLVSTAPGRPMELSSANKKKRTGANSLTDKSKSSYARMAAQEEPIWRVAWRSRVFQIVVLCAGLFYLSLILFFQDWLARHPKLLIYMRDGFLLYTVFFIGWYGLAQLSIVNVLTFVHMALHDFQWENFLIDPMMFILWSFVAATLLLWGRGVYCGWLCPFGALQELTNQLARRLGVKQWEFPAMVHERLWAVKYIILLALFGISLQSLVDAERYAEIEPFKTAITLRFQREWGFVFFAVGMILVSMVNRKFYCKYLCPLGAALTYPARFRIFDWLRRHRECGHPCQVCAQECEVQAIKRNGEINPNECHYCLDCQVTYWNDHKCPPLVEKRKRRERSVRAKELVLGMEQVIGQSKMDDSPCNGCRARDGENP